ncbi:MAG: 50S ribosomal protein L15, partial [Chloroflexota bacterium]
GHGSGRGKTAGKGTKGQNARSGKGTKLFFEGGQNPWTMRIPHRRGFSRRRFRVEAQVINLHDLEARFSADETVTLETLHARGLIRDASGRRPVKLLGDGTLSKPLTLQVHRASASARAAVEQAGGTVALLEGEPGAGEPAGPSPAEAPQVQDAPQEAAEASSQPRQREVGGSSETAGER